MSSVKQPSAAQIAEAAAWVAHLHGTRRTADSDRGLQLWLKEDASRERIWEAAAEVWEEVGELRGAVLANAIPSSTTERQERVVRPMRTIKIVALAASIVVAVVGAFLWMKLAGVSTGVGEQRTLALEDGTRVILNTATRVVVDYDEQVRKVELKSGEARFDVARSRERPFIAIAGTYRIEAIGTSFVVRYVPERTSITLVEGRVAVTDLATGQAGIGAPTVMLEPGQRLTYRAKEAPSVDAPRLEKVIAWQRGEVVMDGMRLADAIEEMNRYNSRKLAVEDSHAESLLISGVFQSADARSFANAVAQTYQLKVIEKDGRILLTGDPKAAYR